MTNNSGKERKYRSKLHPKLISNREVKWMIMKSIILGKQVTEINYDL